MSSSQKKGWLGFSFLPRGIGGTNGRTSSLFSVNSTKRIDGEEEGSGTPAADAPQRRLLLGESSSCCARRGSDEVKGWKASIEDGFPEDIAVQRSEKGALAQRIEELEKELYDYQYHMGLLLIERKLQTSEFEELRQGLAEARETLKRELTAFSHTLSEKQKQEHSALMALEDERQHYANLEKIIFKMQAQEKYFSQRRGIFQSLECRPQEDKKLKLKESQNFLDEGKTDISKVCDPLCDEKKEELEETHNSFGIVNNSSKYRDADIISRTHVLTSNKKDAESKQEKLVNKKDLRATEIKPAAGQSSEKQVFDRDLKIGRESLYEELEFKLNKLRKQNAAEGEYGWNIIGDLLVQRKEVESDKVKVQKDKETLNALYSSLQHLKKELMKKRDLLLSLAEKCKTCKTGSILFNEVEIASLENLGSVELAADRLLLDIPDEHLERHMNGQNDDASSEHKGHKSVKTGGFMPCFRQCSKLFSCEGKAEHLTGGNERKAADAETGCLPEPVVSHEYFDDGRVKLDNGATSIDIIEKSVETIHPEKHLEISINAREIECCPNVSSIIERSEGSDLSSKSNRDRPRPIKRTGSFKVIVKEDKATVNSASKEMEQYLHWESGDLKNVFGKSKLNFFNADHMEGNADQKELSSHACGAAISEMYSGDKNPKSANERHHKRQKTSDLGIISPGQKHYNFRLSTILKVSRSQQQKSKHAVQEENINGTGQLQISEHTVKEADSDGTDTYYEPINSD